MFSHAILDTYLWLPKSEMKGDIQTLRDCLTFISKFDANVNIPTFGETDKYFGFPRHHFDLKTLPVEKIIDKRVFPKTKGFDFKSNGLWDYQAEVIKNFENAIIEGKTGFFLESGTGSGKTVMGIKMLSTLNTSCLVIVPKSDLLKQWKDRFLQYSTLKESDIGFIEGGRAQFRGKRVVIGLVQSVVLNRWGDDYPHYFGAVLYDECDSTLPPTTFAPAAALFTAKIRIGMTASPTRTDGLHIVFEKHLAEHCIKSKGSKTMMPTALILKYRKSSGEIPTYLKDMQRRGVLISLLAGNLDRNMVIAKYAYLSYKSKRPTLIISDRISQLETLDHLLQSHYSIPKSEIGYYIHSRKGKRISDLEKHRIGRECNIILGTYGMIKRGTDIQRLGTIIFGTPQSDIRQTQGRISRFLEGKKSPVLIDLFDITHKDCQNGCITRQSFYSKEGMNVKEIIV
jgi:superfamily II DNA or RNA helicase